MGRLYDLERRFVIRKILFYIVPIFFVLFLAYNNNRTVFEEALEQKDYKALYDLIENKDFTYQVFQDYIKYNFTNDFKITSKISKDDKLTIVISTKRGDKFIDLKKKRGKIYWNFNDYVYNWTIKVPKDAYVEVCGQHFENKDGIVTINKIPFAMYHVKVKLDGCEDYNNYVLAGQKIEVNLQLANSTKEKIASTVYEYLKFKENALQNKKVDEVTCLYTNSGIYTEVINEIEWIKSMDYDYEKKLLGYEIISAKLKANGIVEVDVNESWDVVVKIDEFKNETKVIQKNRYTIELGNEYKISQINTIQ